MPNPSPPLGLEEWKDPDLLHIGHVHLDFGGLGGLLTHGLPLYESTDDSWVMGPVMSRVAALSVSDVKMHIEEVYAPRGYWPADYACADHVEFGWERTSNLNLLTGQSTLEEWANAEDKQAESELDEAGSKHAQHKARLDAIRLKGGLSPVAAVVIQKYARRWIVFKKFREVVTAQASLAAASSPSKRPSLSGSLAGGRLMSDGLSSAQDLSKRLLQGLPGLTEEIGDASKRAVNLTYSASKAAVVKAGAMAHTAESAAADAVSKRRRASHHSQPVKPFVRTVERPIVPTLLIRGLSIARVNVHISKTKLAKGSLVEAIKGYHFGDLTFNSVHNAIHNAVNGLAVLPRLELTDLHGKDWGECIKKAALEIIKTLLRQATDKLADKCRDKLEPVAAAAGKATASARKSISLGAAAAEETAAAVVVQSAVRRKQATALVKSQSAKVLVARETASAIVLQSAVRRRQATALVRSRALLSGKPNGSSARGSPELNPRALGSVVKGLAPIPAPDKADSHVPRKSKLPSPMTTMRRLTSRGTAAAKSAA